MALTNLEVEALLRAHFPPKFFEWFLGERGDGGLGDLLAAIAQELNADGFDLVDTLETEIFPSTADEKLPEWEAAFGVSLSKIAVQGSTALRQAQVVARLREYGASTLPNIKAALAAVLGYQPDIREHSRATIRSANSYDFGPGGLTIPGAGSVTATVYVPDGPRTTEAGAQLDLYVDNVPAIESIGVTLTSPAAVTKTWAAGTLTRDTGNWVGGQIRLAMLDVASTSPYGTWTLTLTNADAAAATLTDAPLFVEAVGRGLLGSEGLAANVFEWCVLVDPTLLGATYDIPLARKIVQRWNPAHCRGYLCVMAGTGDESGVYDDQNSTVDGCVFA